MTLKELQELEGKISSLDIQFRSNFKNGRAVGKNKKLQAEASEKYNRAMRDIIDLTIRSDIYAFLEARGIKINGGPAMKYNEGPFGFDYDTSNLLSAIREACKQML